MIGAGRVAFSFNCERWVLARRASLTPQEQENVVRGCVAERMVDDWCEDDVVRRRLFEIYEEISGNWLGQPSTTDTVVVTRYLRDAFDAGRLVAVRL